MMKRLLLLILLGLGSAACSTQNRDAGADLSSEEVFSLYYEISSTVGTFSNVSPDALVQDPRTLLWASGSSSARPAPSILPLVDPLALFPGGFSSYDFIDAVVIFIDGISEAGQRYFGLFARVVYPDGTPYYYAGLSEPDSESFTEDDFQVPVAGANPGEILVLRTTDLSDDYSDELGASVKLEIWVDDGSDIFYAGQVSTMAGYGTR